MKRAWTLAGAYACAILTFTSLPTEVLAYIRGLSFPDVFAHTGLYVPLGVLVFRALSVTYPRRSLTCCWLYSLLLCGGFAALDEVHQIFIRGRWCDIRDWLADMVGILAGTVVIILYSMARGDRPPAPRADG